MTAAHREIEAMSRGEAVKANTPKPAANSVKEEPTEERTLDKVAEAQPHEKGHKKATEQGGEGIQTEKDVKAEKASKKGQKILEKAALKQGKESNMAKRLGRKHPDHKEDAAEIKEKPPAGMGKEAERKSTEQDPTDKAKADDTHMTKKDIKSEAASQKGHRIMEKALKAGTVQSESAMKSDTKMLKKEAAKLQEEMDRKAEERKAIEKKEAHEKKR